MTAPVRAARRSDRAPVRTEISARKFGRETFRFRLLRDQRDLVALDIDPYVEHVNWGRDSAIRTGELNFRRPLSGLQAAAIASGDRVLCEVDLYSDGTWRRLWEMTVDTPSHEIASGTMSLAMKAAMKPLEQSRAAFSFRGQTARQITLAVARRFHVRVGHLPAAQHRIEQLDRKHASPVDVVTAAWKAERTATGRRFDVNLSRGLLDVDELREPQYALAINESVMDGMLDQTLTEMASAVVVTSSRKGARTSKIRVKVVDQARLRRYGYIVRRVNHPGLNTEAAAREYGKQWLARQARPTSDITFTHPGLPFLDRGAVIRLRIPVAEFDQLVYVRSTDHQASAGSYTMDVTAGVQDPWADQRKERAKRKREEAARKRQRGGATATTTRLTPARGARRS